MTWLGYNTKDSLRALIQPTSEWTTNSKPLTVTEIETLNAQIYNEMNMMLSYEGVNIDLLLVSDLSVLSLVNSYGSASIIEKIKYSKVPQRTQEKAQPQTDWQIRYKETFEIFIKAKKIKNSQSSKFGTYTGSNSIELTPLFTIGDSW